MSRRRKHAGWSEKKSYAATYREWLGVVFKETPFLPQDHGKDIMESFLTVGVVVLWVGIMLTFPISLPIIAYIRMKLTRQRLVKRWGLEELTK